MFVNRLGLIGLLFVFCMNASAATGQVQIDYQGAAQTVKFDLYLPPGYHKTALPILVCIGGLPNKDGIYTYSGTRECRDEKWESFADMNQIAILGVGFLFDENQWKLQASYQFPFVWSADALEKILQELAASNPINPNQLYLFGISAGAQFDTRLGLLWPERVRAVAAHAAGSYDPPTRYVPTKYLITVGEKDNEPFARKEMAEEFVQTLKIFKIDNELMIVPGIAHQQTEEQNERSRLFFEKQMSAASKLVENSKPDIAEIPMGASRENLFKTFPFATARTHRIEADKEWITYDYGPEKKDLITFYLEGNRVAQWGLNAREEIIDEYIYEFVSGGFNDSYPKIFQAIRKVLIQLPQDVFLKATDRRRPVVFLNVITTGVARFANGTEMTIGSSDPPAFQDGFYIIKLGDELNNAEDVQAIEGVIAHELAHDVLGHLHEEKTNCEMERQANQTIKEWGFGEEFKKASTTFGAKSNADSPCFDK